MFAMERIFNIMSVIFIFYLGKLEIPSENWYVLLEKKYNCEKLLTEEFT